MTRSRKKLDLQAIEQLAFVGCSVKEIAVYLGREEAELRSRRCLRALTKGRISFSIILRRRMFELAVGGNIPLLMFLHNNPQPLNELRYQYEDLTHEQLIEQMKRSYEKAGLSCEESVIFSQQEPSLRRWKHVNRAGRRGDPGKCFVISSAH
jgi:hypothetical protein